MDDQLANRLDRIDEALGEIQKAIVTLARVEERQSSHNEALTRMGKQIDRLDLAMEEVKTWRAGHKAEAGVRWGAFDRALHLLAAAVVGYLASLIGRLP